MLKDTLQHLLEDIKCYLEQIDKELYAQQLTVFSGSSIGQHTRHMIEFLQCLFEQFPSGIINYDARKRVIELEALPQKALEAIIQLETQLATEQLPKPLLLNLCYPQLEQGEIQVATNLDRELVYNIEHITHHLAMIKIALLLYGQSVNLPNNFGVAYSTVKYRLSGR